MRHWRMLHWSQKRRYLARRFDAQRQHQLANCNGNKLDSLKQVRQTNWWWRWASTRLAKYRLFCDQQSILQCLTVSRYLIYSRRQWRSDSGGSSSKCLQTDTRTLSWRLMHWKRTAWPYMRSAWVLLLVIQMLWSGSSTYSFTHMIAAPQSENSKKKRLIIFIEVFWIIFPLQLREHFYFQIKSRHEEKGRQKAAFAWSVHHGRTHVDDEFPSRQNNLSLSFPHYSYWKKNHKFKAGPPWFQVLVIFDFFALSSGIEKLEGHLVWKLHRKNSKEKLVKCATEVARLHKVSIQSCTQNRPSPKV